MSKVTPSNKKPVGQKSTYDMLEMLLPFTHEWVRPGFFDEFPEKFNITNIEAKIFFLTQLYHNVRLWPDRLFPDPDNRQKLLEEIQSSIDNVIEKEEEMLDLAGSEGDDENT